MTVSGSPMQIKRLSVLYKKLWERMSIPFEWNVFEDGDPRVPGDVKDSYRDLLTWEAICRKSATCGERLNESVTNAERGMHKAVEKSLGGWKCRLLGFGCGNVSSSAAAYVPKYVYRASSGTPQSMTPRPGADEEGLSTFDNIEKFRKGAKLQKIDTEQLDSLEAVPDGGGHVSIRPRDMSQMEGWIGS
ncbi:hypothetical protein [Streptomyces sp. 8L]|uniref:hypothetical protein n=1 Tax=Streptomyces sp. 8L TaxID=2877242 RepID=UPI001CD562C0|nr:hypothetical protein [Streptomyces sp. 8L]MCA1217215.1 hypothetical protein [Streptomyces sp. 8L]